MVAGDFLSLRYRGNGGGGGGWLTFGYCIDIGVLIGVVGSSCALSGNSVYKKIQKLHTRKLLAY